MRKASLLNAPIARVAAQMGHTDSLCLGDAGLPIPPTVERIDLAIRAGLPAFLDVLPAIGSELVLERAVLAEELRDQQPDYHGAVLDQIGALVTAQNKPIQIDYVSHEAFKRLTGDCKAIVRTGEFTPYANVILYSGVPF
ncbi:D-ribose pyranase [Tropicimonas sp. TH_r6]|uniref:D-ribose pyranase n=1 Tax=Tropicimonas sp. TH_r6 TaxID=3082085 RepID=UPI002954925E|nr:D-ribose pyranase [Tropicimonas sp. TH_r6]MDV7143391.1 D-ribose pyranase [Tropicimonas sp. TH_r6]